MLQAMKVLIVGATGGIGQALARGLAGHELWLSGRNGIILSSLAAELGAQEVAAELSSEADVAHLMQETSGLDLLLYAAGGVSKRGLRDLSLADWNMVMAANFQGAVWCLKHAQFKAGANAVFLGVYPNYVTLPGFAAYLASKMALENLLSVARKEYRKENVGFSVVRLPAVATGLWDSLGGAPKNALSAEQAAQGILQAIAHHPVPNEIAL